MPGALPCIDFHTHEAAGVTCTAPERILRLLSTAQLQTNLPDPPNVYRTLELHPWGGEPFTGTFAKLAGEARFIAVGEVGLDKNKGKLPLDKQREVFRQCAALANRLRKPLVIHCVGCFSELLEEYKHHPWQVPTVLHYFCGKPELAEQLLARRENWYLSLPPLATQSERLMEFLRTHEDFRARILLETDDPAGDIEAHYQTMSKVLDWEINAMRQVMTGHLREIFQK